MVSVIEVLKNSAICGYTTSKVLHGDVLFILDSVLYIVHNRCWNYNMVHFKCCILNFILSDSRKCARTGSSFLCPFFFWPAPRENHSHPFFLCKVFAYNKGYFVHYAVVMCILNWKSN